VIAIKKKLVPSDRAGFSTCGRPIPLLIEAPKPILGQYSPEQFQFGSTREKPVVVTACGQVAAQQGRVNSFALRLNDGLGIGLAGADGGFGIDLDVSVTDCPRDSLACIPWCGF